MSSIRSAGQPILISQFGPNDEYSRDIDFKNGQFTPFSISHELQNRNLKADRVKRTHEGQLTRFWSNIPSFFLNLPYLSELIITGINLPAVSAMRKETPDRVEVTGSIYDDAVTMLERAYQANAIEVEVQIDPKKFSSVEEVIAARQHIEGALIALVEGERYEANDTFLGTTTGKEVHVLILTQIKQALYRTQMELSAQVNEKLVWTSASSGERPSFVPPGVDDLSMEFMVCPRDPHKKGSRRETTEDSIIRIVARENGRDAIGMELDLSKTIPKADAEKAITLLDRYESLLVSSDGVDGKKSDLLHRSLQTVKAKLQALIARDAQGNVLAGEAPQPFFVPMKEVIRNLREAGFENRGKEFYESGLFMAKKPKLTIQGNAMVLRWQTGNPLAKDPPPLWIDLSGGFLANETLDDSIQKIDNLMAKGREYAQDPLLQVTLNTLQKLRATGSRMLFNDTSTIMGPYVSGGDPEHLFAAGRKTGPADGGDFARLAQEVAEISGQQEDERRNVLEAQARYYVKRWDEGMWGNSDGRLELNELGTVGMIDLFQLKHSQHAAEVFRALRPKLGMEIKRVFDFIDLNNNGVTHAEPLQLFDLAQLQITVEGTTEPFYADYDQYASDPVWGDIFLKTIDPFLSPELKANLTNNPQMLTQHQAIRGEMLPARLPTGITLRGLQPDPTGSVPTAPWTAAERLLFSPPRWDEKQEVKAIFDDREGRRLQDYTFRGGGEQIETEIRQVDGQILLISGTHQKRKTKTVQILLEGQMFPRTQEDKEKVGEIGKILEEHEKGRENAASDRSSVSSQGPEREHLLEMLESAQSFVAKKPAAFEHNPLKGRYNIQTPGLTLYIQEDREGRITNLQGVYDNPKTLPFTVSLTGLYLNPQAWLVAKQEIRRLHSDGPAEYRAVLEKVLRHIDYPLGYVDSIDDKSGSGRAWTWNRVRDLENSGSIWTTTAIGHINNKPASIRLEKRHEIRHGRVVTDLRIIRFENGFFHETNFSLGEDTFEQTGEMSASHLKQSLDEFTALKGGAPNPEVDDLQTLITAYSQENAVHMTGFTVSTQGMGEAIAQLRQSGQSHLAAQGSLIEAKILYQYGEPKEGIDAALAACERGLAGNPDSRMQAEFYFYRGALHCLKALTLSATEVESQLVLAESDLEELRQRMQTHEEGSHWLERLEGGIAYVRARHQLQEIAGQFKEEVFKPNAGSPQPVTEKLSRKAAKKAAKEEKARQATLVRARKLREKQERGDKLPEQDEKVIRSVYESTTATVPIASPEIQASLEKALAFGFRYMEGDAVASQLAKLAARGFIFDRDLMAMRSPSHEMNLDLFRSSMVPDDHLGLNLLHQFESFQEQSLREGSVRMPEAVYQSLTLTTVAQVNEEISGNPDHREYGLMEELIRPRGEEGKCLADIAIAALQEPATGTGAPTPGAMQIELRIRQDLLRYDLGSYLSRRNWEHQPNFSATESVRRNQERMGVQAAEVDRGYDLRTADGFLHYNANAPYGGSILADEEVWKGQAEAPTRRNIDNLRVAGFYSPFFPQEDIHHEVAWLTRGFMEDATLPDLEKAKMVFQIFGGDVIAGDNPRSLFKAYQALKCLVDTEKFKMCHPQFYLVTDSTGMREPTLGVGLWVHDPNGGRAFYALTEIQDPALQSHTLTPQEAWGYFLTNAAEVTLQKGETSQARKLFQDALEIDHNNVLALQGLTRTFLDEETAAARGTALTELQKHIDRARDLRFMGTLYFESQAHVMKALIHYQGGNLYDCSQEITRAISRCPAAYEENNAPLKAFQSRVELEAKETGIPKGALFSVTEVRRLQNREAARRQLPGAGELAAIFQQANYRTFAFINATRHGHPEHSLADQVLSVARIHVAGLLKLYRERTNRDTPAQAISGPFDLTPALLSTLTYEERFVIFCYFKQMGWNPRFCKREITGQEILDAQVSESGRIYKDDVYVSILFEPPGVQGEEEGIFLEDLFENSYPNWLKRRHQNDLSAEHALGEGETSLQNMASMVMAEQGGEGFLERALALDFEADQKLDNGLAMKRVQSEWVLVLDIPTLNEKLVQYHLFSESDLRAIQADAKDEESYRTAVWKILFEREREMNLRMPMLEEDLSGAINPIGFNGHFHEAMRLEERKDWANAEKHYEIAYESVGDSPVAGEIALRLARACDKNRAYEKAMRYYRECLEKIRPNVQAGSHGAAQAREAFFALGEIFTRIAIKEIDDAPEILSQGEALEGFLATSEMATAKDFVSRLPALQDRLELRRHRGEQGINHLGYMCYQAAALIGGEDQRSLEGMALMLSRLGRKEDALLYQRRLLALHDSRAATERPGILIAVANVEQELGLRKEAFEHYVEAFRTGNGQHQFDAMTQLLTLAEVLGSTDPTYYQEAVARIEELGPTYLPPPLLSHYILKKAVFSCKTERCDAEMIRHRFGAVVFVQTEIFLRQMKQVLRTVGQNNDAEFSGAWSGFERRLNQMRDKPEDLLNHLAFIEQMMNELPPVPHPLLTGLQRDYRTFMINTLREAGAMVLQSGEDSQSGRSLAMALLALSLKGVEGGQIFDLLMTETRATRSLVARPNHGMQLTGALRLDEVPYKGNPQAQIVVHNALQLARLYVLQGEKDKAIILYQNLMEMTPVLDIQILDGYLALALEHTDDLSGVGDLLHARLTKCSELLEVDSKRDLHYASLLSEEREVLWRYVSRLYDGLARLYEKEGQEVLAKEARTCAQYFDFGHVRAILTRAADIFVDDILRTRIWLDEFDGRVDGRTEDAFKEKLNQAEHQARFELASLLAHRDHTTKVFGRLTDRLLAVRQVEINIIGAPLKFVTESLFEINRRDRALVRMDSAEVEEMHAETGASFRDLQTRALEVIEEKGGQLFFADGSRGIATDRLDAYMLVGFWTMARMVEALAQGNRERARGHALDVQMAKEVVKGDGRYLFYLDAIDFMQERMGVTSVRRIEERYREIRAEMKRAYVKRGEGK